MINTENIVVKTKGGRVGDSFVFTPHEPVFNKGQAGYFFLDYNEGQNVLINNRYGFGKISNDGKSKVYFGGVEYDRQAFETGIISETKFLKLNPSLLGGLDFEEYSSLDTCSRIDRISMEKEIAFSFDNITYSEDLTEIEFDVMAQVNFPGLKFGKGSVQIDYSSEFGGFIVANDAVEITKGVLLENDVYTINYADASQQKIIIAIESGDEFHDLFTFTDQAELLFM